MDFDAPSSGSIRTLYDLKPDAKAMRAEIRDVWGEHRHKLIPEVLIEEPRSGFADPTGMAHCHRFMAKTLGAFAGPPAERTQHRYSFRTVLVYPRNTKLGSACLFVYGARHGTDEGLGWHLVEILELNDTGILVGA